MINDLVTAYAIRPIRDVSRFFTTFQPPFYIQPKLDGERVFLINVDGETIIANRRRWFKNVSDKFDIPRNCVLDGELMAISGDFYDFLSAKSKDDWNKLMVYVFDVPSLGDLKLSDRLDWIEENLKESSNLRIIDFYNAYSETEALELAKYFIDKGFEGAVIKADAPYIQGSWLKIKKNETLDVVILGIRKTRGLHQGIPESFLIGLFDNEKGKWIRLGHVSSGLSKIEKMALLKTAMDLLVEDEDQEYIYLKPEIVLEIEYQEFLEHSFRSPRIKRIRWDKNPRECLISQLNDLRKIKKEISQIIR